MEGKKALILSMVPFIFFILLGSIFLGVYFREAFLAREQLLAMDELEKFGDSDVSGGGHCHVVHVYVTVTRREEAVRLINVLTKLNISVRSDRIDQRYVNMYGNLRLGDIKRFERMCRENGWVVSYFNNSKACLEKVLELQKENEIILEHINDLNPKSQEILLNVLESNKRKIEEIEKNMNNVADLNIYVDTSLPYTPVEFHGLSVLLAVFGLISAGVYLMWRFS